MISFQRTLSTTLRITISYLSTILLSIPLSLLLLVLSAFNFYAGYVSYIFRWRVLYASVISLPLWAWLEYLLNHPIRQDGPFFRYTGLWLLRRFSLGRRAIAALSQQGVVKPLLPPLPVEVWSQIIQHAIDVPEYLGTDCKSKDLPDFLYYHQMQSNHLYDELSRMEGLWSFTNSLTSRSDPYNRSEKYRNELRLVCKRWRDVIDWSATRWAFQSQTAGMQGRWRSGIQRLEIYIQGRYMRGDDDSLYHGTYLVPYQDQLAATRLLAVREETWGDATWAEDAISHLSLNPPGLLESIQSFAYHCCESVISAESISLLSTSLPHLRILILETREIKGDVTFPHLHTLQIISDNINLYGWQCPTLQHLALTTNDVLDGHRYDLSIIPDQFSGLTALLVRSLAVTLDDTFWSRFPRLEMLGFYRITVVDPPPKSHPLSHLYSPRYDIYYTQPDEISAALDVLNPDRERTLQIGRIPPAPDLTMNSFSKDWEALHKKCKAAGIRWRKLPADVDFVDEWPKLPRDFWKDDRIGVWIKTWRVELFFASILGLVTVVLVAELLHFSAPRAWDRFGQGEAIAWGVVFPLYYLSNVIKLDLRRFIPTQVD